MLAREGAERQRRSRFKESPDAELVRLPGREVELSGPVQGGAGAAQQAIRRDPLGVQARPILPDPSLVRRRNGERGKRSTLKARAEQQAAVIGRVRLDRGERAARDRLVQPGLQAPASVDLEAGIPQWSQQHRCPIEVAEAEAADLPLPAGADAEGRALQLHVPFQCVEPVVRQRPQRALTGDDGPAAQVSVEAETATESPRAHGEILQRGHRRGDVRAAVEVAVLGLADALHGPAVVGEP